MIELHSISIENVRGFDDAYVDLSSENIVLVGQNNSGKSSLLILLDLIFNILSIPALRRNDEPDLSVWDILQPARHTRNKARRINLYVQFNNRVKGRRFKCDKNGLVRLRIGMRTHPKHKLILKIGDPAKNESQENNPKAFELLELIRENIDYEYIPAVRDASSNRFKASLQKIFREQLTKGSIHNKAAGSSKEYRETKSARETLEKVAEKLTKPVLTEMQKALPPGLLRGAIPKISIKPEQMINWLSDNIELRLVTGDHDELSVSTTSVGSGLQSLLDFATNRQSKSKAHQNIIAIDEPEAFLHPSAQRVVARSLLKDGGYDKTLLTTHSPIIVQEVRFSDLVLCKDHELHTSPKIDDVTDEMFCHLLHAGGAEMLFSSSVLLVEGEGDRLFFESVRRRIAEVDSSGTAERLFVIPVGGKRDFGPWIKMLGHFTKGQNAPISWLAAVDGDAASDILETFKIAKIKVPPAIERGFQRVHQSLYDHKDLGGNVIVSDWFGEIRSVNSECLTGSFPVRILTGDLEYLILQNTKIKTTRDFATKFEYENSTKDLLLRWLGSKGVNGAAKKNAKKAPWMRGYMGQHLPREEMHDELIALLQLWLCGADMHPRKAKKLLKEF